MIRHRLLLLSDETMENATDIKKTVSHIIQFDVKSKKRIITEIVLRYIVEANKEKDTVERTNSNYRIFAEKYYKLGNRKKVLLYICLQHIKTMLMHDDINLLYNELIDVNTQRNERRSNSDLFLQQLAQEYHKDQLPPWSSVYRIFVRAEAFSNKNKSVIPVLARVLSLYGYLYDERGLEENFKPGKYRINKDIDDEIYGEDSDWCARGTIIKFETKAIINIEKQVIRKSRVIVSSGR